MDFGVFNFQTNPDDRVDNGDTLAEPSGWHAREKERERDPKNMW